MTEFAAAETIAHRGPTAPAEAVSRRSVPWALAGLSLSMLMPSLDTSIANVGLPTLERAFAASFQAAQWIVLAYLLAIATLIVGAGRLGDLVGRRRLLVAGIGGFTAASLLCGLAPSLPLLIAARALQGAGAAVMMALTLAMVGETVSVGRTGSAMGLLGSMSAIGTSLGPSLGGVLIAWLGWRSIFLVNVPLGVVNLFLAHRYLPADRRGPRAGRVAFDAVGTVLLAGTLGAYALAMTIGRGGGGPLTLALLAAAAAGLALFTLSQAKVESPLITIAVFRLPGLTASLIMSLVVSTVVMATLVVGPFYLTRTLGLGPAGVGAVMSVGPLVAAVSGVPAGRLVDRFGPGRMTILGLLGMAGGLVLVAALAGSFGIAGYLAPIVIVTADYALFQAANNTAVVTGTPEGQRGVISGMLNLSRNVGLITGASVMGAVFTLGAGTNDIATASSAAVAAGMRLTFGVAGVLIVVGIIAGGIGRGRPLRRSPVSGL